MTLKKTKAKKKSISKTKGAKKVTKKVLKKASKKVSKITSKKSSKKPTVARKASKLSAQKKTAKDTLNKKFIKTKPAKTPSKLPSAFVPSMGLKLGQVVPEFTADSTSGDFKLSDYKGKNIVLYFYPKDNTSGCTLEGYDFSEALPEFNAKNTVVFGISRDSIKSHHGFKTKHNYKHHLISDPDEKICNLFGVIKEKSMYGRVYLGVDRSTFLIDPKGVLKIEWRNVKVNGHVADVLSKI